MCSMKKSIPRGQAENLIKAHKLHLASDRTPCTKATANPFRLLIHTAAYWLMHGLRDLAPVRHAAPRPDQGCHPRHRDRHQDQDIPAHPLRRTTRLRRPGPTNRRTPAMTDGAACPTETESSATSNNPKPPRPKRYPFARPMQEYLRHVAAHKIAP